MAARQQSTVLVLDDNLGDIDLLATAWIEAGHDSAFRIRSCSSCDEAIAWLAGGMPPAGALGGALIDLMLFDRAGRPAVEVLSEHEALRTVPIIAWSGIAPGRRHTDRLERSVRIWKKPVDWTEYADFTLRLYHLLGTRSAPDATMTSF